VDSERAQSNRLRSRGAVSRRRVVIWLGAGAAGAALTACGGTAKAPRGEPRAVDYAARFAGFQAAAEPNGDLAKVTWPDFVLNAGDDVRRLYEFQVVNGDLMRYMPCFCGCSSSGGHRNNRDCYIKAVNADGSVVFDAMAPT
jgi:hypothetical protein